MGFRGSDNGKVGGIHGRIYDLGDIADAAPPRGPIGLGGSKPKKVSRFNPVSDYGKHIAEVVNGKGSGIRDHYMAMPDQRSGKVTVTWTIGPDGKVRDATIKETTLHSKDMEGFLLKTIGEMKFVPSGESYPVEFPFAFHP